MKIEFVKETKIGEEPFWYTTKDGKLVDGSLKHNEKHARALFQIIASGVESKKEIIETVTI